MDASPQPAASAFLALITPSSPSSSMQRSPVPSSVHHPAPDSSPTLSSAPIDVERSTAPGSIYPSTPYALVPAPSSPRPDGVEGHPWLSPPPLPISPNSVNTISPPIPAFGDAKTKPAPPPIPRWSANSGHLSGPKVAEFHPKISRRPVRNRVFVTSTGKVWSSPNVDSWPHNVEEDGPPTHYKERMLGISWQDNGWPAQGLLPRYHLQRLGIFGCLSPMHSLEREYEKKNEGYVPRRGPEWAQLEQKLLLIAETLFTHVVFDWDSTIPMTEKAKAPGWYMSPQPDRDVAFNAGNHQISRLLKLGATVSLYCAIAWMKMGHADSWITVLEQKACLTSQADKEWLNELRGSWVCQFDSTTNMGVFIEAATWKWPNLLHLFTQVRVPVMIYWGPNPNDVRKDHELVPAIFRPNPVEITSATLVSTNVVETEPVAGQLQDSLRYYIS
jgi:hypothetical protein